MKLRVKRLSEVAILPQSAHEGDAGLDLCSVAEVEIAPGDRGLVSTGFAIELPRGTEAEIRPRSGLALRHGVTVLNSPGTIDQGYRGEILVLLINHGKDTFRVSPGMKVAQLIIRRRVSIEVIEVAALSLTKRGESGFGSTDF